MLCVQVAHALAATKKPRFQLLDCSPALVLLCLPRHACMQKVDEFATRERERVAESIAKHGGGDTMEEV
jgi:hypothetical protein